MPGNKGRSVNLYIDNWQSLGTTVRVSQYSVDIRFVWTDDAGEDHEKEATLTFPNALGEVPLSKLRERVEEWLIEIARVRFGVDNVVTG